VTSEHFDEDIGAIAALAEPTRRDLYAYIASQPEPVSRDQAAAALEIPRHTVKFHLDKLVDGGLLSVHFRRLSGLNGPGAGRPSKLYSRSEREVGFTLPERDYRLAADILASAIETNGATGEPIADACRAAARLVGESAAPRGEQRVSDKTESLMSTLSARGYEPRLEEHLITLVNCPFHQLAQEHTELVCTMNLDLLDALLQQGEGEFTARLDPQDGRCCVVVDL
jgi:predicted ArsR family transcriptional regulator